MTPPATQTPVTTIAATAGTASRGRRRWRVAVGMPMSPPEAAGVTRCARGTLAAARGSPVAPRASARADQRDRRAYHGPPLTVSRDAQALREPQAVRDPRGVARPLGVVGIDA